MRTLQIAIGLIEQGDEYVLQRRDNKKHIGAAGLIGCFGGQIDIETNESPAEAVARELAEETSLITSPEQWKYIGHVKTVSDRDHKIVTINAEVFGHKVDTDRIITAIDGQIARIKQHKVHEMMDEFTPATKAVFEQLIRS